MDAGGLVEVARFEEADEVRAIGLALRGEGGAHIYQLSCGCMTELAFGERAVCHRLTLDDCGLRILMGMLGEGRSAADALARFFESGGAVLADLLDICDRAGIAWTFCSMGERAGTMARAAVDSDGGGAPSLAP
ncbi:MAG: hypothetical protein IJG82_02650 [Atopobiaceae bacterium]|nr:hypothetical protein [Atopobiaceae bacterium]